MDQASVCVGFLLRVYYLKKAVNIFERMDIAESIYKGVVEPSYKNLLGKMPTRLVTEIKREDNPHHNIFNPR